MIRAPFRLGLVGVGRWGRTVLAVVSRTAGIEMGAVVSRKPETRSRVGPTCRVVGSWQELLSMDLDGVWIATPPGAHCEATLGMIEAGVPVLVEKPVTLAVSEAEILLAAARRRRAVVMVDHTQLHSPGVRALASALEEERGTCPRAVRLVLRAGAFGPFREDVSVLWDWGSHDVAIALALLRRDYLRVEGAFVRTYPMKGPGRAETWMLELRDDEADVSVSIRLSNVLPEKERVVHLFASGSSWSYTEYPVPSAVRWRCGEEPMNLGPLRRRPLDVVLERFVAAAREGIGGDHDLVLARGVVRILERAEALAPRLPGTLPRR